LSGYIVVAFVTVFTEKWPKSRLTYEEYKQKQKEQAEELGYEYRHELRMKLPEEVKELYDYEFMPFSEIAVVPGF
jgi:hypothetical protein